MIAIEEVLISQDIVEEQFICDLDRCKGQCCVQGDAGAPLEQDELPILDNLMDIVKPYLAKDSIEAINEQGAYVLDEEDGVFKTPLVNNAACAYMTYKGGISLCAIEQAHKEGKIKFKKPISCHLYPIRISKYDGFEAMNYEVWSLCKDACLLGEKYKTPVYVFLKEALVRKYGQDFYDTLCAYASRQNDETENEKTNLH